MVAVFEMSPLTESSTGYGVGELSATPTIGYQGSSEIIRSRMADYGRSVASPPGNNLHIVVCDATRNTSASQNRWPPLPYMPWDCGAAAVITGLSYSVTGPVFTACLREGEPRLSKSGFH